LFSHVGNQSWRDKFLTALEQMVQVGFQFQLHNLQYKQHWFLKLEFQKTPFTQGLYAASSSRSITNGGKTKKIHQ
jgi:hypothetical protein